MSRVPLSKNFISVEFTKDNWELVSASRKANIQSLVDNVLQPLRSGLRTAVRIQHSIDSKRTGTRYGAVHRDTFQQGTGVLVSIRHELDPISLSLHIAHHIPTVKFTSIFIDDSPSLFLEYDASSAGTQRNILPAIYRIPPSRTLGEDGDARRRFSATEQSTSTVSSTSAAEPPWLTVARAEMKRGVREDTSKDRNDARVMEYHAVTKWYAKKDSVAWCSSFAHWCMLEAGVDDLKVTFGARTFSPLHTPDNGLFEVSTDRNTFYLGSVIVIKWQKDRPNTGQWRGHVTFLISVSEDKKTCRGLGGNQGDRVKISDYKMSDILSFSWPHGGSPHTRYELRPSGGNSTQTGSLQDTR
jgi:uncharacterized protein (TIGR02594 family)